MIFDLLIGNQIINHLISIHFYSEEPNHYTTFSPNIIYHKLKAFKHLTMFMLL